MFAESRAGASGEGRQGQEPLGDLHGLLAEVQSLRAQLERSVDTDHMLQSKLEEQLAKGEKKAPEAVVTVALQPLPSPQRPPQPDQHGMLESVALRGCAGHVSFGMVSLH